MEKNLSPRTQKFKYMLSDLNDHHNMRVKHIEGQNQDYLKMTIWFGGLRNSVKTNIALDGNVLYGELQCVADTELNREKLEKAIPSNTELYRFRGDNGHGQIKAKIVIQYNDSEPIEGTRYIEMLKNLKKSVLELNGVQNHL